MNETLLDNPVWYALLSGNKHLALGNGDVKYFHEGITPFVGLRTFDASSFQSLARMLSNKTVAMVTAEQVKPSNEWNVVASEVIHQMIARQPTKAEKNNEQIVPLDHSHVPAMLELTSLTQPGPFLQNTIAFGSYHGIFEDGRLAAMTGRRFYLGSFIEISAVCTHPDFTGKGYGSMLLKDQIGRIHDEGALPYLHVRQNNEGAIHLYQKLGFVVRQSMNFILLRRA